MDDPGLVGVLEGVADLDQDLDLPVHRERLAPLDLLVEVFAGQVFLDDVGDSVLDAEVVDGDDVPMVEIPREFRFLEEALLDLLVLGLTGLDGDDSLDVGVPPLVHLPEPADPDFLGDLVLPDFFDQWIPRKLMIFEGFAAAQPPD